MNGGKHGLNKPNSENLFPLAAARLQTYWLFENILLR